MQFQVPQFIETEDKIIGPLTLKQFLYLAAAGVIVFLLFWILKTWLWFIAAAILGTAAAALAFIKYNGRPLTVILTAALNYLWKPRSFIWKKTEEAAKMPEIKLRPVPEEKPAKPLLQSLWLKMHTAVSRPKTAASAPVIIHEKLKGLAAEKHVKTFEILRKMTGERQAAKRVDYR
jgi:hypothetical protein